MKHIMYLSCQQREKDDAGEITITGPMVSTRNLIFVHILKIYI